MRFAVALASVALGGCHYLFQLNDLNAPPDAPPGKEVDAFVGPTPTGCWSGAYTGDEDQDTIVDGCDNCPLQDNRFQEDSDGDGIGDICDGHPLQKLERIAYFHPMTVFNTSEWHADGVHGNWQDNTSGIQQANTGNESSTVTYARVETTARETFDQPRVQVLVKMATPDDDPGYVGDDRSALGVYVITGSDASTGLPSGVRCGIEFPLVTIAGANAFVEKQGTANFDRTTISGTAPPALITLDTYDGNKVPTEDNTPTCSVRVAPGVDGAFEPVFTAVIRPDDVRVAVWAMNASVTFLAMFVTERMP